jgi:DNA-binding LacI/PurR family transcriptional regulator
MAIGALEALRTANRKVPDDIAVIGYDGMALTAHCSPPLTTIRQRVSHAGKLLVENLLQYINCGIVTNTVLPVELIPRYSTVGDD